MKEQWGGGEFGRVKRDYIGQKMRVGVEGMCVEIDSI